MNPARIADELAIQNLVARYSDAIVRRAASDWGDTWTDDAEWHLFGRVTRGRSAIVAQWEDLLNRLPFVHQQSSGGLITFPEDPDRASGRWYVTEWGMGGGGPAMLTLGVYHDDYVRDSPSGGGVDDSRWRFERRRFAPLYMGPPDLTAAPRPFPSDD